MRSLFLLAVFLTVILGDLSFAKREARIRLMRSVLPNAVKLHVQTEDSEHILSLRKPESSVFSPDFKLHFVSSDGAGKPVFYENTPSKEEIEVAEATVYVDQKSNAALHIHDIDGQFRISGHFGDQDISHEDGKHFVTFKGIDYVDLHRNDTKSPVFRGTDYIDFHRNVTPVAAATRAVTSVNPELAIVLDYANYLKFNGNNQAMVTYLSLFIHSVNNRYANIASLQIRFTVTGLQAISTASAQPFITGSATPAGNTYDIDKILDAYSKWIYANSASVPKHDLAPLITAVHLQSTDSTGKYIDGVAGLAYLKGACWINGNADMGTSVNADAGAAYVGVTTLVHELAHNLGSPHDAEPTTAACPWSDGYLMSYEGGGTLRRFYFSSCSISMMNTFISSNGGICLKSFQSTTQWAPLGTDGGDFMNLTAQCQASLNNPQAYVDPTASPDDVCRSLKCNYPDANNPNSIWTTTLNRMPADGSYCGESGSCTNGYCVVQPSMTAQCQTSTGRSDAYVDPSVTADSLCSNLVCRYPGVNSGYYVVTTNKPAIYHSPCGKKGRCINNACSQPPPPTIPPSMDSQCQSATGKSKAYVDSTQTPDQLCTNLQCKYPDDTNSWSTWTVSLNRPPTDYTPCGTNGNCLNGKCALGVV